MTDKGKVRESFSEVWASLLASLGALNKVMPGVVVVLGSLFAVLVWVATFSLHVMAATVIIVVVLVSVIVYATTSNYGEAALALVAGLLTAFSVAWDAPRFAAFMVAWLVFSFFALMISSIKIAAGTEDIYRQASLSLADAAADSEQIEKELRRIGDSKALQMLGPIERAETLRIFAFRKLELDVMEPALKAVGMLSTITKVDCGTCANFIADAYRIFDVGTPFEAVLLLDQVYEVVREAPTSPQEFMAAYDESKRLVLARHLSPDEFFVRLTNALREGVPTDEMYDHLRAELG